MAEQKKSKKSSQLPYILLGVGAALAGVFAIKHRKGLQKAYKKGKDAYRTMKKLAAPKTKPAPKKK